MPRPPPSREDWTEQEGLEGERGRGRGGQPRRAGSKSETL